MDATLPLLVAVPLLGAALLVAGGRLVPRFVAEIVGCAVSAGTAALALVLLLNCSPPFLEWVGGWTPVDGRSVGIVLTGDGPGLGMAALASLLTLAALAYSWHYFDEPPRGHAGSFPALLLLFQGGMCGFAIAGDLFNAFVWAPRSAPTPCSWASGCCTRAPESSVCTRSGAGWTRTDAPTPWSSPRSSWS